jgi:hypothetical protein
VVDDDDDDDDDGIANDGAIGDATTDDEDSIADEIGISGITFTGDCLSSKKSEGNLDAERGTGVSSTTTDFLFSVAGTSSENFNTFTGFSETVASSVEAICLFGGLLELSAEFWAS